ncbi:PAS domain-containing protein [Methylobacterium sp. J-072]|uniref:PAS domain-containing protein n=1 Tax=Methylobacterium sp. J-072 TaxID=2836651 RepID=UPI001FBBD36A|nr:PAS domain-containing protein [Methylobacterium sp. J-072]MCJ2091937.1 PAS domain-containing protein [Methylobacterium sp. J-072]
MLKLVEERGGLGFWSLEIATCRLWGSPGFYRVAGLPLADDLRSLFRRLVHPDDEAAQADLWDLLRSGHAVDREFRIIRPDQTVRWVALKTEVVLGSDARPARVDGILLDITATHEARRIAAWMQARQTGVLRAVAAATWSALPTGEIEMAAGWGHLTGQSAAEMAGTGWLDAVHPDDRQAATAAWQAARTTGAPYRAEYRIRGADGQYRRFSGRGAPQADPDGAVREWFGLVLAMVDDPRDAVTDATIGPLIRGARAVIGWSIQDLAEASGVSGSSVRRMEEFGESPRPRIRQAVRQALEGAGIRFVATGTDQVAIEIDLGRFPQGYINQ